MRGAIAKGKMYWSAYDANVTVGQGLIEAYRLESTVAIYPRIVVSDALYEYIAAAKPSAYPFAEDQNTLLANYVATDADGVRFLDLLHPDIRRAEGECLNRYGEAGFSIEWSDGAPNARPAVLDSVAEIIQHNLATDDERRHQKFAWLQTYRSRHDGQT